MKNRIVLLLLTFLCAFQAGAQVQANKQIQMVGTTATDRRITGVSNAVDSADAVNAATLQQNRLNYSDATASGNDLSVNLAVAPVKYQAGMIVSFRTAAANTGSITLNVNNIGIKPVYKNVNQALSANDIVAGQVVSVIFDGNAFQVISQLQPVSGFTGALSGDVSGTQSATLINDNTITTNKLDNGAVTDAKVAPGIAYSKLVGVPTSLPPSGNAGGDLSGSYPNPAIAQNAVTTDKITDAAVTSLKIQDGAIISLKLADGSVLTAKIADAAITTEKVSDAAITTAKIADGAVTDDKVTSVAYSKITGAPTAMVPTGTAGGDLSGTYPNPAVGAAAITTAKIADGAVTDEKVSAVAYGKITGAPTSMAPSGTAGGDLSGTYPNPVIATEAITATKIADGAVTTTKITDASIITDKIADGAVTDEKVASVAYSKITGAPTSMPPTGTAGGDLSGSYPNPAVAPAAITTAKIADGAVTDDKVNSVSYSKITGAPTSMTPAGTAGGDLTGTYPNPVITADAITATKIADGAVVTTKIADGAVTDDKVNTVSYSKITGAPTSMTPAGAAGGDLSGTFPNPTVAAAAITTAKIADGAVTDDKVTSVAYGKITGAPTSLAPNGAAGGDLSGTYPNPAVAAAAITTAKIADGAVTDEKVTSVDYTKITNAPTSMAPTGTAGGDLSGTYPNPVIATEAITATKIADGAVTTTKITDASIITDKIADGAVTIEKMNPGAALSGQVITFDGTGLVWNNPSGMNGPAGGDLTGNYPNPVIGTAAVTSGKIADGSIFNNHVHANASIAYSKLNLFNSITNNDLAANAVTNIKIANNTITNNKLNGTGATSGQVLSFNGSGVVWTTPATTPTGAAGGDLSGTYPNPTVLTGAITSAKIADGAITNADVNAAAAIDYSKLKLTNSITAADITNSAITNGKISDGAISTGKIADEAVTDAKIASGISYYKLIGAPTSMAPDGAAGGDLSGTYPNPVITTDAITTVKIADGAVVTNKIADANITTEKINDNAVTPAKINASGAQAGQVLSYDGTSVSWTNATGPSLQYHGTINSAVSYPANAATAVVFSNTLSNTAGQMDASTGTFTAAASGLYQFAASLPAAATGVRFLSLRVNGVDVFTGSSGTHINAAAPFNTAMTVSSLHVSYPLNVNDQVSIYIYTDADGATPLTNGTARLLITKLN